MTFEEIQRFRQVWLWALLSVIFALTSGIFGWGIWTQILHGRPWGNRPMPDGALVGLAVAVIGMDAILFGLFIGMRLIVRVDGGEVLVRLAPFPGRRIPVIEINEAQVRTVSPLREFGGLGIRGSRRNRGYLVAGGEGVQLVLGSGDRVFIGSARAQELERAIAQAKRKG